MSFGCKGGVKLWPACSALRWQDEAIEEDPGSTEVQMEDPPKPAGTLFQALRCGEQLRFACIQPECPAP